MFIEHNKIKVGDIITTDQIGQQYVNDISLLETEGHLVTGVSILARKLYYRDGTMVYLIAFEDSPTNWLVTRLNTKNNN